MILTITLNPCIDKSTRLNNLEPESKLRCAEIVNEPGGGGINVSKALQKLGANFNYDIEEMKQALQAGNTDTVCKKAHKLKSSAGIIQADKLINLLADIEAAGKKGIVDNEMSRLVENAAQLLGMFRFEQMGTVFCVNISVPQTGKAVEGVCPIVLHI